MNGEGLDRIFGFELLDSKLSLEPTAKPASTVEEIALKLYSQAKVLKAAGKPFGQVTLPENEL